MQEIGKLQSAAHETLNVAIADRTIIVGTYVANGEKLVRDIEDDK
jgi:hypothetical protein